MLSETEDLFRQAAEALKKRQYALAEKAQRQAIDLLEPHSPEADRLADELQKLASIHFQQKRFALAATEYQRVLSFREASLSANNPRVLQALYWLGKSHFNDAKYDLAQASFRRALEAAETLPGAEHNIGAFLCELGFVLYFVGHYSEAEPFLLRALQLYGSLYGENDLRTAWILERIALNYDNCPDLGKDPEPYYERAARALKPDGDNKCEYASNLCRWAQCVAGRKRFEQADKLFAELLALIDDSPAWNSSAQHWIVSSCVEYFESRDKAELIADLAARAAGYDPYGDMVRQALDHAEQTLADDDQRFAEALFSAGNNALFHSKYAEAEKLLRRALHANIKAHGEDSEQVVANLCRLCVVARELENWDEAESTIQRALGIAKQHFANAQVHPRAVETLAFLREVQGRNADATALFAEAVSLFEQQCGYPSYETLECLYRQSGHLLRAGKLADAEVAIRRVTTRMHEVEECSSYERADYVATLASVLGGLGRTAESEEATAQAEELMERGRRESEDLQQA